MTEIVKLAIHKGTAAELELGGLRFLACRREIGEIDGGVTLKVIGPATDAENEEAELLRFDCFRKSPHFHAPGENSKETKIDSAVFGDGRDWVYEQLATNTVDLLGRAGWTPEIGGIDLEALNGLVPRLRALVESLAEPSETSYFEVDAALLGS